jgi:hypothetical protein
MTFSGGGTAYGKYITEVLHYLCKAVPRLLFQFGQVISSLFNYNSEKEMKKITVVVMFVCFAAMLFLTTGCTSVTSNDGANAIGMENLKMPVYAPIITRSKKKVTGTSHLTVLFGIFSWGDNKFADNTTFSAFGSILPDARNAAVYNACERSKSDLILAAKYEVEKTNYFFYSTINCTVTGFPAVIKDLKEVKAKK